MRITGPRACRSASGQAVARGDRIPPGLCGRVGGAWTPSTTSLALWLAEAAVRRSRRCHRLGSGKFRTLGAGRNAPPPDSARHPGAEGQCGTQRGAWEGPARASASRRARPQRRATMIPEDRRDGPGAGEERAQLQAAGSVRKVGAPAGPGRPEPPAQGCGASVASPVRKQCQTPGGPLPHFARPRRQTGRSTGETEARRRAGARVACLC